MRKSATNQGIFGRRGILGASMLALSASMVSGGAMAQTAPAAEPAAGEVVIVTGIRKGLQDSINAKRLSVQIGDGVNAEDIGKLPDVSIAESIARLPGIAAQRTNGRAQSLSVRGLGPDYTVTTLNGREQVSTNDNRSVEFDQYPSELINAVFVYKTPNASMVNQGVAGTADLLTVRPLTFGRRVFAVSARREQNSESAAVGGYENFGNRFSATYIDTFMDGTVGVALGFAHTTSPYQATKDEPWGDGDLASTNGAFLPGGQKNQVQSSNLKRDGLMGVLEFRPNDRLHVTIDGYHSDFKEIQQIARLEYPLAWGGATLSQGTLSSDGKFYNSGTFTGVKVIVENYANRRASQIDEIGFNLNYDISDNWSVAVDANRQVLSRTDLILETTAGTGPNGVGANDTVSFVRGPNNSYTISGVLDYTSFDNIFLTDPKGWGGSAGRAGYVKNPTIDDELSAIRLSATRTLESSLLDSVTFGFNQTTHTKTKVNREGAITLPGLVNQTQVPAAYRRGTTDASFLGNGKGMIAYDALGLYDSGYYGFSQFTGDNDKKNWTVDETIQTAYIMANIDTEFAGVPVTGNIGVQYVHSDQSARTGYTTGNGGTRYVIGGDTYTDVLPSINLNFAVADNLKVRFGAGTTTVRPRMDQMAAGTSYETASDTSAGFAFGGTIYGWKGDGGNSAIRPWKSNNFDISVERYFGRRGYLSAALFYKDLTSYIFRQTVLKDFTGAPLPSHCFTGTVNTNCLLADTHRAGFTSTDANGDGGYIRGAEFSLSLPFELFAPSLDGFGLIASAAFNDSSINPTGTGEVAIPGLSEQVINTTIYYEKHGFSARLSNRYRGDFVGEVPDYTNSLQTRNVRAESILDAQMSYTFQSGPANGLNLSFSASNITNEPFFMYKGANVVREEKYGATYMFGASYRF